MAPSAEEQVRALVIAYAERLDAGDLDGVAQLFARGTFRNARGGRPREGVEAVRQMYDQVRIYDDNTPRTKHVLGNIVIDVDEQSGSAEARCTFTVMQQAGASSLRAVLSGQYRDRFACVDGEWCFRERVVHPELLGDLSEHMDRR